MSEKKENNGTVKSFKEKVKGLKNKEILIAVLAVVVMLIIYFTTMTASNTSSSAADTDDTYDYCADMQSRIETAVNMLVGAEDSKVIVSWESSIESIIAYVTNQNGESISSSPQLAQGLPIILKEIYPKALGIAVVCKNGSQAKVKLEIISMISTLLDISSDKIVVLNQN